MSRCLPSVFPELERSRPSPPTSFHLLFRKSAILQSSPNILGILSFCNSRAAFTSALRLQTLDGDEGIGLDSGHRRFPVGSNRAFALLQESIKKKDLASGKRIQSHLRQHGLDCDAYWGDHLIRMFTSCNELLEADYSFRKVRNPSVYTWCAIISAHTKLGDEKTALELFYEMLQKGYQPDKITFLSILKACRNLNCALYTRCVHDKLLKNGFQSDNVVANALADVYSKCGNLAEAHYVFDAMPQKDVVSWCALITGYTTQGKGLHALELFERMQREGIVPDRVIFISLLKACSIINTAKHARMVHEQVIRSGHGSDLFITSSLVDIYAKSGWLPDANKVFDTMQNRNAVSWVTLIVGYAQYGDIHQVVELLGKLFNSVVEVDKVAFLSIMKACGIVKIIRQAMLIHKEIIERGLLPDKVLENTLVDMYARCGDLENASAIFEKISSHDVVSWGAMITGYGGSGSGIIALDLFDRMQHDGVMPNLIIFLPVLNACSNLKTLKRGMVVHELIVRQNFESDLAVANKLVDMYAKRGRIEEAENVFRSMMQRDVVSWGTIILGCAEHGHGPSALELYEEMWRECVEADRVIFLCILKACGSTGAIKQGMLVHYQIMACGFENDVEIGNTLVDMYSKIGTLDDARKTFDQLHVRDIVSWAAMVSGYAHCGNIKVASQCFCDMQEQGLQPHDGIFTSLLVACTHAGVLHEGRKYFRMMINEYSIKPTIEHYNCIIDLLGRVGQLREAISIISTMPISTDVIVWTSLLTSCRTYRDLDLGKHCFSEIQKSDPEDASAYMLMSSIYADAGMWDEVSKLETLRKFAGAQKKRGMTWIEVNNKVHEFIVGDAMTDTMLFKFQRLSRLIKKSSYLPQLDSVIDLTFDE